MFSHVTAAGPFDGLPILFWYLAVTTKIIYNSCSVYCMAANNIFNAWRRWGLVPKRLIEMQNCLLDIFLVVLAISKLTLYSKHESSITRYAITQDFL